MKTTKSNISPIVIAAFAATYFIWGSTYLANKIVIKEISPFLAAGLRFFACGILVALIAVLFIKDRHATKVQLKNTFIASLLFLIIGNGGVMYALKYVDSGYTALLISSQPLVLLLQMWIHQGKKIKLLSWIGVGLGMLGIYLLVAQNGMMGGEDKWLGTLIIMGCIFSWGYGSLFVAKADLPENFVVNSGYQMFFGGLGLIGLHFLVKEPGLDIKSISINTWWVMIYLILFGSLIAFTAFNFLLKRVSPEKVATNTYVNPIVAMVLGWWVLNEVITKQSVLAAFILLLGVYFINTNRTSLKTKKAK